jgi:hypothetical protein
MNRRGTKAYVYHVKWEISATACQEPIMVNIGPIELMILILFSFLPVVVGIAGIVLGVVAFFKVRRLEKLVSELQSRINVTK